MWFETQAKADNFLKFNKDNIAAVGGKAPTRSYYCSFCCGWHVTSIDDDAIARERDARDEQLWESLRRRNEKLDARAPGGGNKAQIQYRKKLPKTIEGNKIHWILNNIDGICIRILNAMASLNLALADDLIEKARAKYREALDKSEEYGIYCNRINYRGDKIAGLASKRNILKSMAGSPERRQAYLASLSDPAEDMNFAQIVRNLGYIETVESLFSKVYSVLDRQNHDEKNTECKNICSIVRQELTGTGKSKKQLFGDRLDKILRESIPDTNGRQLSESEKQAAIKIIELIQESRETR